MDIDFTCPQYIPFHFVEQLDLFLDSRPCLSLTPYTHSVAGTPGHSKLADPHFVSFSEVLLALGVVMG